MGCVWGASAHLGGAAAAGEVALDGELVEAEGGRGHVLARADAQAVRDLGNLLTACGFIAEDVRRPN